MQVIHTEIVPTAAQRELYYWFRDTAWTLAMDENWPRHWRQQLLTVWEVLTVNGTTLEPQPFDWRQRAS